MNDISINCAHSEVNMPRQVSSRGEDRDKIDQDLNFQIQVTLNRHVLYILPNCVSMRRIHTNAYQNLTHPGGFVEGDAVEELGGGSIVDKGF